MAVYRDLTFTPTATTRYSYDRVNGPETKVGETEAAHVGALGEWPSFVRETFGRLYRPTDATDRPVAPGKIEGWASKATTALEQQPTFPELRLSARSHRVVAAEAASLLSQAVGQALGLDKLPIDAASVDPRAMERRTRRLADEVERIDSEGGDSREARQDAQDAAKAWGSALARRKVIDEKAGDLAGKIAWAVKAIGPQIKATADAVAVLEAAGVGRGGDGIDGDIPDDLVKMAMGSEDISKILRMLGKMREAQRQADYAPVGQGNLDVVGIVNGKDPTKLIASEVGRLGHPFARLDVLNRLANNAALVKEQRGEKQSERGDFVIEVDVSGSMAGEPVQWARAVSMAMMLRALTEGRTVIVVMFDDGIRASVVVKPGDGKALADAMRAMMMQPGGGTDAVLACKEARSKLSPDQRLRVDTVIVTDGFWQAAAEDVVALRRSGGTFRAVLIGASAHKHEWLDGAWLVDGTKSAEGGMIAHELFQKGKKR